MTTPLTPNTMSPLRHDLTIGLSLYVVSTVLVQLGVLLGLAFFRGAAGRDQPPVEPEEAYFRFDGRHYRAIAVDGYTYDPAKSSNVAFFPVYPLLARGTMRACGCSPEIALMLVSNGLLAATFVLLHRYARLREPDATSPVPGSTVAALAFFPPSMFFHMAYSESSFLCVAGVTLLAIHRRSPAWVVAALAGLASGTRPVGVAFLPVALLYMWRGSASTTAFAVRVAYLGPLACWGLLAYMAYQYQAFGDPLAFARTQAHWEALPGHDLADKVAALLTLEPIWAAFTPSSPRYWASIDRGHEPVYSLYFLNPIIFVAAAGTVVAGAGMRLMTRYEVVLAAGLLLIPYWTKAYENSMFSMSRFSAVVLPCYLAWGRIAPLLPGTVRGGAVALGGYFLGVFAAMFAAGYLYY